MHPSVRQQYKLFMVLAERHPTFTVDKVRGKVKAAFMANAAVAAGSAEFKRALARGRWELKELEALIDLHRYRAMRQRYAWRDDSDEIPTTNATTNRDSDGGRGCAAEGAPTAEGSRPPSL